MSSDTSEEALEEAADQEDVADEDLATPDLDALDPDDREEVAAAVAEADQEDVDDVKKEEGGDDEAEQTDPPDVVEGDVSLGHVYCQGLGVAGAGLVARFGDEEDDQEELVDEYAALAKQMDLDLYLDQWIEEHGMGNDLSPGQAVAVFTVVFFASVLVSNPEIADGLLEEVDV